jgi:phosphate starvation-inducible protein PhoH and related proteins
MNSYSLSTMQPSVQAIRLLGWSGERFVAAHDALLKTIESAILPFCFQISATHEGVQVDGDKVAVMLVAKILERIRDGRAKNATEDDTLLKATVTAAIADALKRDLVFTLKGVTHPVQPVSLSQVAFLQTLLSWSETLVIGIGPVGTGKTHLAIAAGLNQLAEERVKRVVVTRPHVVMEGEIVTSATRRELEYDDQFEFLEDILRDLIGYLEFRRLIDHRKLELVPLGHMRGRTFNDSFIIVDEAQNMTVQKMQMVISRIGRASRMVLTGDPTHVDLLGDESSGLVHLLELLKGTDIAKVHRFEKNQIVRNNVVARLEELYASVHYTE